jgi:dihydropteroate synthase
MKLTKQPTIEKLSNNIDKKEILKRLDVDSGGVSIMSKKMNINIFYIRDMYVGAANILKQDALAIGAELAVPNGVIICKDEYVDAILIANDKQVEILSKKELAQPFGLKKIAKELNSYRRLKKYPIEIMGVVNANEDSFFSGSRFVGSAAISHIESMISDGASIIDLGGVSSRPGSEAVSADEELRRLKPILDEIYSSKLYDRAKFSLDSYAPSVLEYALDRGFSIVNDITGLVDDEVAKISAKYDAQVVIMHMQGTPRDMQLNPTYTDVVHEVDEFFATQIGKANSFGIKDIVLDVGIGFGKRLEDNLRLIKSLSHFSKYNLPILMGASRKSMIDKIVPSSIDERLAGTIAIHLKSIDNGASIIRCHDVKEHYQAIKLHQAIEDIY